MFFLNLLILFIQSFFIFTIGIVLLGVIRLLFFGPFTTYKEPLKDKTLLKKGDIILTGKQSIFHSPHVQISNVLSRKLKHRFWTHAAIYQGNGKVLEAQPEGIIEKDIDQYFNNGFILRAFRHKYIRDDQTIDQVLQFCVQREKSAYDMRGVIFYTLSTFFPVSFNWFFDSKRIDKLFQVENAYFCSELVVDAFQSVGYPISPYDGWRVKPTDFISNPSLEVIGEAV